jgi:hypothetical protein
MTEEHPEIIKKKRGRKPKSYYIFKAEDSLKNSNPINSEEEKVILHLPITINEINTIEHADTSIFIKNDITDQKSIESASNSEYNTTCNKDKIVMNNINKILTHTITVNENTRCWWCHHSFNAPAIQLPENYYNDTFYCIGHFCSYNCAKAYNISLNDILIHKRESLINLMYYKTYGYYINIKAAPHWFTLKKYGGILSIDEYRHSFNITNKEFVILHPPMISRQMQIEESYKIDKLKEIHINKINKIYSEMDSEYVIKRNKKLPSADLNLEVTMGIKRTTKNK